MHIDHLLHITEVHDGYTSFDLTCEHTPDSEWNDPRHGGTGDCWLKSWWEGFGNELLGPMDPPFVWPLPVTNEGCGEDCSIVKDEHAVTRMLRLDSLGGRANRQGDEG